MNYNLLSGITTPMDSEQPSLMVGYRFHPTDDELVGHFLKHKILGQINNQPPISEIKVCDFEPWDLPALVNKNCQDQVWYFFCTRDYKYFHSRRSNRTTKAGYWKPTGKPRKVKAKRTEEEIGTKRSLVFYIKDRPKPKRTKWIMHEYECIPNSTSANQGSFLLCKLKFKADAQTNKSQPGYVTSASVLEDQNSSEIDNISSLDECGSSNNLAFDFEDNNSTKMTAMSTYDKSEQDGLPDAITNSTDESHNCENPSEDITASLCEIIDFDFQSLETRMDISEAFGEGDQSPITPPFEKIDMSPFIDTFHFETTTPEAGLFEEHPLEAFYHGLDALWS